MKKTSKILILVLIILFTSAIVVFAQDFEAFGKELMKIAKAFELLFLKTPLFWLVTTCLLLTGFLGAYKALGEKFKSLESFKDVIAKWQTKLGITSVIAGILVLFLPYIDPTIFLGDLIPGLVAIFMGLLSSLSFLKTRKGIPEEKINEIENKLSPYQTIFGFISMGVGAVHLIFGYLMFI